MRVWMYEMIYKEIEGFGSAHFDGLCDGVWRASVGNVRPEPMLVVRDEVGMAYMGRPFAPYLSIGVFPKPFDRLKKPDGLSWRRSHFGFFS